MSPARQRLSGRQQRDAARLAPFRRAIGTSLMP